ncbi:hypothetical protein CAY53_04290 [Desulfobulbus oralis]|uniref:Uncharacterized protein n=1 Tax=Desulfobulbus oralis TaxID=1986146 RepID=A0A2L1GMG1_9BACT|nr:hypothetical protein CAY53_04290 [Desulfobulbus oralis]
MGTVPGLAWTCTVAAIAWLCLRPLAAASPLTLAAAPLAFLMLRNRGQKAAVPPVKPGNRSPIGRF